VIRLDVTEFHVNVLGESDARTCRAQCVFLGMTAWPVDRDLVMLPGFAVTVKDRVRLETARR
jgi:hypothetical protein